ncbi:SNF2 helicase associated domain-containing protein, partial [Streptococcus pyogenes]
FRGKFHAKREVLQAKDLYQFFTDGLSNLRTLGVLTLAQEVEDLLVEDAPQISVSTSGSLLDISFDFSGIAVDEIQAATQALLN